MPLEALGHGLSGFARVLLWIITDLFIDILIQGAGFLICRVFNKSVDPDGFWVTIVGLIFWGAIIYFGASYVMGFSGLLEIDSCLNDGGQYDYRDNVCISNSDNR